MADLFHYRTLTESINQIKPTPRLLLNTLLKGREDTFSTKTVEFDVEVTPAEIIPLVERNMPSVATKGHDYKHYEIEPATIKYTDTLLYDSAWTERIAGDALEGIAADTLARKIARKQKIQKDKIFNTIEYLASLVLLNGAISYNGDYTSFSIDFEVPNGNKPTSDWSDTTAATPLEDIRKWKKLVEKQTGITPTLAFVHPDLVNLLLSNEYVLSYLDNRRINIGTIDMRGSYIGRLLGVDIYEFDETVVGTDGNEADLQGANPKFVITAPEAWKLLFGAAYTENGPITGQIFADSWEQKDPRGRVLYAESHPLPILTRSAAIVIADVATS